jgi:hypothetical protein
MLRPKFGMMAPSASPRGAEVPEPPNDELSDALSIGVRTCGATTTTSQC